MNTPQPRIEPWPIGIAGFFVVLIAALATWAVVAQRNREELVSADYYEQEVAYQQQINRLRRSADSGVVIGFVPVGQGGVIRIAWPLVSRLMRRAVSASTGHLRLPWIARFPCWSVPTASSVLMRVL